MLFLQADILFSEYFWLAAFAIIAVVIFLATSYYQKQMSQRRKRSAQSKTINDTNYTLDRPTTPDRPIPAKEGPQYEPTSKPE